MATNHKNYGQGADSGARQRVRGYQVDTLIDLCETQNSKLNIKEQKVSYMNFVDSKRTKLNYHLILILSDDEIILYAYYGLFTQDVDRDADIRYLGTFQGPSRLSVIEYLDKWETFALLTDTRELFAVQFQGIIEGIETQEVVEKEDIFNDLLKRPRSSTKASCKNRDSNFYVLSEKSVVNFKVVDDFLLVLGHKDKTLHLSVLSHPINCTDKKEILLGGVSVDIGEVKMDFDFPFLIVKGKGFRNYQGCSYVDNELLGKLNSSISCFSDCFHAFVGIPAGIVFTFLIPSQYTENKQQKMGQLDCVTTSKLLFHHSEPIKCIAVFSVSGENDGDTTFNEDNKEQISVVAIIGKQGRVKLLSSGSSDDAIVTISDDHIEGPIVDFAYQENQNYLVTVCPRCINLQKFVQSKNIGYSKPLASSKKARIFIELLASFPITGINILKPVTPIVYHTKQDSLKFWGINKHLKLLCLNVSLELLSNKHKKVFMCGASACDTLKSIKNTYVRKKEMQCKSQIQNSVLVKLNLAARIISDLQKQPEKSDVFCILTQLYLKPRESGLLVQVSFSNNSRFKLVSGWSLLTRLCPSTDDLCNESKVVYSHVEMLPTMETEEKYNYNVHVPFFRVKYLPLILKMYLILSKYEIQSICSASVKERNVICLNIYAKKITLLDIQGAVFDSLEKTVNIPISQQRCMFSSSKTSLSIGNTLDLSASLRQVESFPSRYSFKILLGRMLMNCLKNTHPDMNTMASDNFYPFFCSLLPPLAVKDFSKCSKISLKLWNGKDLEVKVIPQQKEQSSEKIWSVDQGILLQMESSCAFTLCIYYNAICQKLLEALEMTRNMDDEENDSSFDRNANKCILNNSADLQQELRVAKAEMVSSRNKTLPNIAMKHNFENLIKLMCRVRSLNNIFA